MPQSPVEWTIIEKTQTLLVWTLKHIEKFGSSDYWGVGDWKGLALSSELGVVEGEEFFFEVFVVAVSVGASL